MTQPVDDFPEAMRALGEIAGLGATTEADWERFNRRYQAKRVQGEPLPQRTPTEDEVWK